jgi:hypothetical protein
MTKVCSQNRREFQNSTNPPLPIMPYLTHFSFVSESCSRETPGAFCTVVDLVLTVYSRSKDSISGAEKQVQDDFMNELKAGAFLNDNIIAVRLHEAPQELIDSSIVNATGELPKESTGLSILGTVIVSIVAFLVILALMALTYNKKVGTRSAENGSDHNSTNGSASTIAAQPTTLAEHGLSV